MVEDALTDQDISESERRMLDRMSARWSISPERAAEIEQEVRQSMASSEEHEYTEMLKGALEDGEITPKERRLLERMRVRWGISPERAAEIEASLRGTTKSTLTATEQEYLDEVRFVWESGQAISEGERRLLSRFASSLGLDDARAAEIERMVTDET
jgi:uncharacterized membrane protein YebE (DUF533 family)